MVIFNPTGDTYVDKTPGNADTNYSSSTLLYISKKRYSWDGRKRVLLEFDISSLSGAIITAATLGIYWEFADVASRGKPLTVHRTTSPWSPSTVTYNTQPTYTGGGGLMYLGNWSWKTSDIKTELQNAVDAGSSTLGLIIIFQSEHEENDHFGRCRSVETASDPYLSVAYTNVKTISGNVKDQDGINLSGVTITLKNGTNYSTITDSNGNYTQIVNADLYDATATKHGYPSENATVDATSSDQIQNFILICIPREIILTSVAGDRLPIPQARQDISNERTSAPSTGRDRGNIC